MASQRGLILAYVTIALVLREVTFGWNAEGFLIPARGLILSLFSFAPRVYLHYVGRFVPVFWMRLYASPFPRDHCIWASVRPAPRTNQPAHGDIRIRHGSAVPYLDIYRLGFVGSSRGMEVGILVACFFLFGIWFALLVVYYSFLGLVCIRYLMP